MNRTKEQLLDLDNLLNDNIRSIDLETRVVGRRCRVKDNKSGKWLIGRIIKYDPIIRKHFIQLDDKVAKNKWLRLFGEGVSEGKSFNVLL